jgi:hypothetical protein
MQEREKPYAICHDHHEANMVRAILSDGKIKPLDPLPPEWADGTELQVTEACEDATVDSADEHEWYREMQALTAELNDPREWEQLEAELREADRAAKAKVREQMGLPLVDQRVKGCS